MLQMSEGLAVGCAGLRELRDHSADAPVNEFLARYPKDDSTTFRCECGHPRWNHDQTMGACMVTTRDVSKQVTNYCPCLNYRQVRG